jgi:hypothetical protein
MLPATSEAEKVRFHTLNRATGNRVHARYVDAETGNPVDDEDQVKGYERENGEYVMLERDILGQRVGKGLFRLLRERRGPALRPYAFGGDRADAGGGARHQRGAFCRSSHDFLLW